MLRPRELASGLELFPVRTPTLLPATHTNSYALGGREVVLVEPSTPYEDERAAWVAWARGIASQGRTLVAILATHHHPDHVGGAEFLARELLLPVWTSEETAARVSVRVTRILKEGDEIALEGPVPQKWRVMVTPGHAPGHVCLVEDASRTAIVGDMVASVGTILIARGDGDMRVYLRELARLGELNAALALPAHGEPVDAPSALFAYYIQHRLKREKKGDRGDPMGRFQRNGSRRRHRLLHARAIGRDRRRHIGARVRRRRAACVADRDALARDAPGQARGGRRRARTRRRL